MTKAIIKIPVIDRDSRRKYGKYREFRIAKLTPLFRRRLFRWLYEDIFMKMDAERRSRFEKMSIDIGNGSAIMASFLLYLEENSEFEKLLAHLIIPKNTSAREINVNEIAEFLEQNIMPAKEAEIIAAFFMQTAVVDMAMALQYLKKAIKNRLSEADRS
ncbi:MAG: hypothetical protein ACLFSQ_11080 [Candidatus Zixiibacteriota bacterium]